MICVQCEQGIKVMQWHDNVRVNTATEKSEKYTNNKSKAKKETTTKVKSQHQQISTSLDKYTHTHTCAALVADL